MADWNAGAADYLADLGRRPGAVGPSTIADVWNAEWERTGLDTITGVGKPLGDAYEDLRSAVERVGGADIRSQARQVGIDTAQLNGVDQWVGALNTIADGLPEDKRKELEPLRDVRRRASEKALAIEKNAADVAAGATGLSATATAFLAGTARQFIAPENLVANAITAPIGGAFSGPILRVVARQAAAGGVAQLMVEPSIQSGREQLGLESGVKHGAMDVAQAAIGAGGLAALLRAGAAGYRMVRRPRPSIAEGAPIAEAAPEFEPTFLGYMDHEDAAAFERGEIQTRPHALSDIEHLPGFAGDMNIAEGAQARPTRTRLPDEPAREFEPSFRGYMEPEDLGALDRGQRLEQPRAVTPFGDETPGYGGNFSIAEGALARPTRTRAPAEPAPDLEPSFRGTLEPDDVAALDRGGPAAPVERPFNLAELDGLDGLSGLDFEAAARFMEREQLIDGAAPAHWNNTLHRAMVDEAAAALEAGRPVDRAKAAEALKAQGLEAPAVTGVADNPISSAVKPEPPKKYFGVHKVPFENLSLFQWLAAQGGLSPDQPAFAQGWVQKILDGNPFVPGFGRLLRKGGLKLDDAWRRAVEDGYLIDAGYGAGTGGNKTSPNDLLDMISQESRGNRQYRIGREREASLDPAEQKALREQAAAARATEFDARMQQLEITKITTADRARAMQIMEKEGQSDALLAYEQALREKEDAREALRARRAQEQNLAIPGYDEPIPFEDIARDARTASAVGGDPAGGAGSRSGEPGVGGAARGTGEGAGAPGAEGQLGDAALAADADRALELAGVDLEITIRMPDGTYRKGTARELLADAQEDAAAAAELFDCTGVTPPKGGGE